MTEDFVKRQLELRKAIKKPKLKREKRLTVQSLAAAWGVPEKILLDILVPIK